MEIFPENNLGQIFCPLFINLNEKMFDHSFKTQKYSESGSLFYKNEEKMKNRGKIN